MVILRFWHIFHLDRHSNNTAKTTEKPREKWNITIYRYIYTFFLQQFWFHILNLFFFHFFHSSLQLCCASTCFFSLSSSCSCNNSRGRGSQSDGGWWQNVAFQCIHSQVEGVEEVVSLDLGSLGATDSRVWGLATGYAGFTHYFHNLMFLKNFWNRSLLFWFCTTLKKKRGKQWGLAGFLSLLFLFFFLLLHCEMQQAIPAMQLVCLISLPLQSCL